MDTYTLVKWMVDNDDMLKDKANDLGESKVIGFNFTGHVSDSLKKKVNRIKEL